MSEVKIVIPNPHESNSNLTEAGAAHRKMTKPVLALYKSTYLTKTIRPTNIAAKKRINGNMGSLSCFILNVTVGGEKHRPFLLEQTNLARYQNQSLPFHLFLILIPMHTTIANP